MRKYDDLLNYFLNNTDEDVRFPFNVLLLFFLNLFKMYIQNVKSNIFQIEKSNEMFLIFKGN